MSTERIKLKSVLAHTADWIYFDDEGNFVAEFYDFSQDADDTFGGDVAYVLKVRPGNLDRLLQRLQDKAALKSTRQEQILQAVQARFASYFEIQKWLRQERIPFEKSFDGWA